MGILNKHKIYKALENMDRFGGSFVQSLAFCYSQAAPDNQTILFNAFETTFIKYANFTMKIKTYKQLYADCPVDKDWSNPDKRELFIQKISNLAFGVDTIERGYPMEEVINRLKKFCEFSYKWEEHSGEESC